MQTTIETAGKHAAATTAVIGLGILITKPLMNWRKRRKAEKTMVLEQLKEINSKQDTIQTEMREEAQENREMHGRIEGKVDDLAKHTRLVMTSTVAVIDALMQHDEKINGIVKEYRKKLSEAIVDGV